MKKYKLVYLLTYNDVGLEINIPINIDDGLNPYSFAEAVNAAVFPDRVEARIGNKELMIKNNEKQSYKFILSYGEKIGDFWDIKTAFGKLEEFYGKRKHYEFFEFGFEVIEI